MERNRVLTRALVVLLGVAYPPAAAYGQSQIVGQVTDNTGGVVPGVTVEAASPVLIEGSRISITDSQGPVRNRRPPTWRLRGDVHPFPASPPSSATNSRCRPTLR